VTAPTADRALDAPLTTVEYDADDSRPLQQIPTTEFKARWEQIALAIFIAVPLLAIGAAGFVLWGHGLSVTDVVLSAVFYALTLHGITVGFHRYFTHGSFKAKRPLRIALAIAGSMAIEGPVTRWVADHRRHHAFSDADGDPHSPWRYGEDVRALTKGLWHAHIGWLFDVEQTDQKRFTPDLLADRDIARISRLFPVWVAVSLLLPALLGGLVTMSWAGALSAFFWASVVRIGVLHHMTWSINSICHTWGARPFETRDRAVNVWWLAALSGGESWHNLHHADPTCARHGVDRGQIDSSAVVIRWFEKLGWARDVRWPKPERLDARRATAAA
jgi:stearoyl-CoA desaturase (delta-9 desaturase)